MEFRKIKKTITLLITGIIALCALAALESQVGGELPVQPNLLPGPGDDIPPKQRGTTFQPETQFKDPQAVNQTPTRGCVLDFDALNSEDIQRFNDLNSIYNYALIIIQRIQGGPHRLPSGLQERLDKSLRNENLQQNAARNCVVFKEKIKAIAEVMYIVKEAIFYAIPLEERGSADFAQS
jgi:hypothetical protein